MTGESRRSLLTSPGEKQKGAATGGIRVEASRGERTGEAQDSCPMTALIKPSWKACTENT